MAEEDSADQVGQENVVNDIEKVVEPEDNMSEAPMEQEETIPKTSPPRGGGSKLWLMLLAVGIAIMMIAPIFMFAVVPGMKVAPADLETETEYDGTIQMLNMDTFSMDTYNITALDTYSATEVDGDNLNIQFTETITIKETGDTMEDLEAEDYLFSIDRKTFAYTDDDHQGQWVFPLTVEAEDYEFWNGDLGETGTCEYIDTVDHEGLSTYEFRMVEDDIVLNLADVFDGDSLALLQSMGAEMTYDVEYIFWVDPDTGTIIDLEKHQDRFLTFPNMRYIPEDLQTVSVNEGNITILDTATMTMQVIDVKLTANVSAVETLQSGLVLLINEVLTVMDIDNDVELLEYGHNITYAVNRATGEYVNVTEANFYEPGRWTFPVGIDDTDYLWAEDGAGNEYDAEYVDQEIRGGIPVYRYEATIVDDEYGFVQMGIGLTGQNTTLITMWVEPNTGTVIDREVSTTTMISFPDLRFLPYDLDTTTMFEGALTVMDTTTLLPESMDVTITASMECTDIEASGTVLIIEESITVMNGTTVLEDYSGDTSYGVHIKTAAYVDGHGLEDRDGLWTFPVGTLDGDGEPIQNFTLWDTWTQNTSKAEYTGYQDFPGTSLNVSVYEMAAVGDVGVMDIPEYGISLETQNVSFVTYYVEPNTGIVVDREVDNTMLVDFPDIRFLPEMIDDGDISTPEVIVEGTLAVLNQTTFGLDTMDITTYIYYETDGLDATGLILRINETTVVMNGTTELPEYGSFASYGVHRKTAQYVDVAGFSTVARTGQFTFPVGIVSPYPVGAPVENFTMWNGDIGMAINATYDRAEENGGVDCLVYEMVVSNVAIPLEMLLGSELIPGAQATYNATYTYWVEPLTGVIIDMERNVTWKLLTLSPGDMMFGMVSTNTYWGLLNGADVYVEKNITSKMNYVAYGTEGIGEYWENTTVYENNTYTPMMAPQYLNQSVYIGLPHNMTHVTAMDSKIENWTFSPNAVANQTLWYDDLGTPTNAEFIGYYEPSPATQGFNISLYSIVYDNVTLEVDAGLTNHTKYNATIIFQVDRDSGVILYVDKNTTMSYYNETQVKWYPLMNLHTWTTPQSQAEAFMTATVMQIALAIEAYGAVACPIIVDQNIGYSSLMVAGSAAKANELSGLVVYSDQQDIPGGNIAYSSIQAVIDATVTEATASSAQVTLSEQTIIGGILAYETDETTIGPGALAAYATGLQLAMFSDNTIPVLNQDMEYSDDNIADSKESADEIMGQLAVGELYVPLILIAIGAVFVVLGLVFKMKK